MSDERTTATVTFRFGFTGLLIYAALGILYHLVTSPNDFSWADPWVWITMGLWPFFLLGWVIVAVIAIAIVVFVAWYFLEELPNQRRRKRLAAERRATFEQRRREAAKKA